MHPFGSERPWSRRDLLVGVSLVLVALGVRLPSMGEGYWIDEVISSDLVALDWSELFSRVGFTDIHPPLYYVLLKGWRILWGTSDWAGRCLSLLFGTLTVAGLYAWLRQRHGMWLAAFAGLYLALSTFHVHYSVEVRSYALFVLLAVMLFASYERWLSRPQSKGRFAGLVGTEVLLLWTHYYALLVVCLMSLHFLWVKRQRQGLAPWWGLGQLIALCGFAAWLPLFLVQALHLPTRLSAHLSDELPLHRMVEAFGPAACHPWPWVGLGTGILVLILGIWAMKTMRLEESGAEEDALPAPTWKGVLPPMVGLLVLPLLPLVTMSLTETTMEVLVLEMQRAYMLQGAAMLLIGLSVWVGVSWSGVGRYGLPVFLCVCGPLLVLLVNLVQPMLFLRNLLVFLIPVTVVLGFAVAQLRPPLRLISGALLIVVALPSLWAGPEVFMPRQDFRGVADIVQKLRIEKTFVHPAWDLPGVQRYVPVSAETKIQGFVHVDELRLVPHDVNRVAVVLTRPTRDQVSREALIEQMKSRFSLVSENLLRGHRGGLKVYRFNLLDGVAPSTN